MDLSVMTLSEQCTFTYTLCIYTHIVLLYLVTMFIVLGIIYCFRHVQ